MPLTKIVRDILVPVTEYPCIDRNARLRDAFELLFEGYAGGRRFRHVLVLDDKNQLVGILGMRDMLRGLFPDYLRTAEAGRHHHETLVPDFPALTLIWAQTCEEQCLAAATKPVRDFMAPVRARLMPADPLTKAAYLLVLHEASMLPVVEDARLVGVVRIVDVFYEAAKVVLNA